jgi:hypothetical protein
VTTTQSSHGKKKKNNNKNNGSKNKNNNPLKIKKKVAVQWYQQELEKRTGRKVSYNIMYTYITALSQQHRMAREEHERAVFLGHSQQQQQQQPVTTTMGKNGVLLPMISGGSLKTTTEPMAQIPFPKHAFQNLEADDDGEEEEQEEEEDVMEDTEGVVDKEEEEERNVPEGKLFEPEPPPVYPIPPRFKIQNATDLVASAYNALHHSEVEVAIQRLQQALEQLGRR